MSVVHKTLHIERNTFWYKPTPELLLALFDPGNRMRITGPLDLSRFLKPGFKVPVVAVGDEWWVET